MTKPGGVSGEQLRSYIERIERLEEEKASYAEDIKEVYGEAKAFGFDVKIMKQVIKLRKMDQAQRQEQEALRDLYMHALGMTPMEEVAAKEWVDTIQPGEEASITVGNVKTTVKKDKSGKASIEQTGVPT